MQIAIFDLKLNRLATLLENGTSESRRRGIFA
jgi:hypothetical protein